MNVLNLSGWLLLLIVCSYGIVLCFFIACVVKLLRAKKRLSLAQAALEKKEAISVVQKAELRQLKHDMEQVTSTDVLTGLVNRQIFEDRLQQVLTQSKRYSMTFAVVVMGFNELKMIHDALGLEASDQILKGCAERLQASIRQLDTVSRRSSDEFVFIFPQLSKAETAAYIAQRLLNVMAQPFALQGKEIYISSSIGMAVYPKDGDDMRLLLKRAETAMHQARKHGHDVYAFYQAKMQAASSREFTLSMNLHHASLYKDFILYVEPVVDLEKKRLHQMRVLLRWNHPDYGMIEPEEFLPLAEKNGKIHVIGLWLIEKACEQFQQWSSTGVDVGSLVIPVTLRQLDDPHFVIQLSQLMQRFNIDPENVLLEISESAFANLSSMSEKSLLMLKELNFQIGVTDFGRESLLIGQFQRFAINAVRVVASLVENVTINQEKLVMLKMMIAFANTLNMALIVSNVATTKQRDALQAVGCRFMQGVVFSPPLGMSQITPSAEQAILDKI